MPNFKIRTAVFLITAIFVLYSGATGQSRKKSTKPDLPKYSTSPLDPSAEIVPSGYAGNDLPGVVISVLVAKIQYEMHKAKDQFETTAEYNRRMEQYESFTVLKTMKSTDTFVFRFNSVGTEYDADNRILIIKGLVTPPILEDGQIQADHLMSLIWQGFPAYRSNPSRRRVLTGSEKRFGSRYYHGITLSNVDQFREGLSLHLPMSVAEAKQTVDRVGLLVLCKLKKPYTLKGTDYSRPTLPSAILDPFDGYSYLNTEVLELWYYNLTTGQVYAKLKPEPRLALPGAQTARSPMEVPRAQTAKTRFEEAGAPTDDSPPTAKMQILTMARPDYTEEARQKKITGTVIVEATFKADGHIVDPKVVRGLGYGLDEKAIEAVMKTQYRPAEKNGKPVDYRTMVKVSFSLL